MHVTWKAVKIEISKLRTTKVHTAKYGTDDVYSTMGYCVEVGPDSRIVSPSCHLLLNSLVK